MDYEKKYKEAVEKIRNLFDEGEKEGYTIITYKKTFEEIFPELAESEDEMIRKEIIKYLEQTVPHHHRDEVLKSKEWIAWLEKQSKKKSAWDKDDEYRVEILYALCEEEMNKSSVNSTAFRELQETRNWLHSLKERGERNDT